MRSGAHLSAADVKVKKFSSDMLRYANLVHFIILLAENDDVFPQQFLKSFKK